MHAAEGRLALCGRRPQVNAAKGEAGAEAEKGGKKGKKKKKGAEAEGAAAAAAGGEGVGPRCVCARAHVCVRTCQAGVCLSCPCTPPVPTPLCHLSGALGRVAGALLLQWVVSVAHGGCC